MSGVGCFNLLVGEGGRRRSHPSHGPCKVCLGTAFGTETADVFVPPQILQSSRSSVLLSAVNAGVPPFSLDKIVELATTLSGYILLSELPDAASSCKRKMWATYVRLPLRVLFVAGYRWAELPNFQSQLYDW